MRSKTGIFLALAAVIVAVAIWLTSSSEPEGEAPESGKTVAASKTESGESKPLRRGPSFDDFAEPTLVFAPDIKGTLQLEGRVLDADEAPVDGATVVLSTHPRTTVKSGADGIFVFEELVAGPYVVVARQAEQGLTAGPVKVQLHEETEPVILKMVPGATLRVKVRDQEGGGPIEGAQVEVRSLGISSSTSDAAGEVDFRGLGSGSYRVVVVADGYAQGRAHVNIPPQARESEVTVRLARGVSVSGRVVTEKGEPVAEARVIHESTARPDAVDVALDSVKTDETGAFSIRGVGIGTYRFTAFATGYAPGTSNPVTVDDRSAPSNIEIVLQPGATLEGFVELSNGDPVEGATVHASALGDSGGLGQIHMARSGPNGAFKLTDLPRAEIDVAAYDVTATSEILKVDLRTDRRATDVKLVLAVQESIEGHVVDGSGEGVAGVQVTALTEIADVDPARVNLLGWPSDLTDANGKFRLGGLEPRIYHLRAVRDPSSSASDLYSHPGVSVRAGAKDVEIVLQTEGRIEGRVAFEEGGSPDMFSVGTGIKAAVPFVATGGKFVIENVAPRTLALQVSGPNFDPTVRGGVTVSPGETTSVGTITVRRGRTISGRVLTEDGSEPVEGARVLAGYRVIGDGAELSMQSWGPQGTGSTKETVSGPNGEFSIQGVGFRACTVIADHAKLGRSVAVKVPASKQSVNIDLILIPLGSLEGVVTRGEKPVEGVAVNASPLAMANGSNLVVSTGPDGRYKFDRMAADTYVVSAMTGMSPLAGMSLNGVEVVVEQGMTARADLTLPEDPVTLEVSLLLPDGSNAPLAEVVVVSGTVESTTAKQIHDYVDNVQGGFSSFNLVITPRPTKVNDLQPGEHTVCAIVFPEGMNKSSTPEVMAYIEDNLDELPSECVPVTLGPEPEQKLSVQVVYPPAAGDDDGGDSDDQP